VLLVVGDKALANTVDLTLQHGPYARRVVASVAEGKAAIDEWKPHLLLVDIDVEAGRAIQLIDEALAHGPTGVIALTRRSDLRGKLDAFERGADDYIGLPFVPDDLVARAEQALLYLLAANAGTTLTREQILDARWGTDFVIESNVVDRHVRALRAKLQDNWHKPRYIETVPNAGYRFIPVARSEKN